MPLWQRYHAFCVTLAGRPLRLGGCSVLVVTALSFLSITQPGCQVQVTVSFLQTSGKPWGCHSCLPSAASPLLIISPETFLKREMAEVCLFQTAVPLLSDCCGLQQMESRGDLMQGLGEANPPEGKQRWGGLLSPLLCGKTFQRETAWVLGIPQRTPS